MRRWFFLMLVAALVPMLLPSCSDDETGGTGTVKVSLQDAPLEGVEKVEVAISEISIHFVPKGDAEDAEDEAAADSGDDPDKAGWRSVLQEERVFDLLLLRDNPELLRELELSEGKVTQIRLWISEETPSTVTIDGTAHDLEISSSKLKVVGQFDVVAGEETEIRIDFDAEQSVTETGNGTYKLRPTVKLLTE